MQSGPPHADPWLAAQGWTALFCELQALRLLSDGEKLCVGLAGKMRPWRDRGWPLVTAWVLQKEEVSVAKPEVAGV